MLRRTHTQIHLILATSTATARRCSSPSNPSRPRWRALTRCLHLRKSWWSAAAARSRSMMSLRRRPLLLRRRAGGRIPAFPPPQPPAPDPTAVRRADARILTRQLHTQLVLFSEVFVLHPQTGGYYVASSSLRITPLRGYVLEASVTAAPSTASPDTPPHASRGGPAPSAVGSPDGSEGGSGVAACSLAAAIVVAGGGGRAVHPLAQGPPSSWPAGGVHQVPLSASCTRPGGGGASHRSSSLKMPARRRSPVPRAPSTRLGSASARRLRHPSLPSGVSTGRHRRAGIYFCAPFAGGRDAGRAGVAFRRLWRHCTHHTQADGHARIRLHRLRGARGRRAWCVRRFAAGGTAPAEPASLRPRAAQRWRLRSSSVAVQSTRRRRSRWRRRRSRSARSAPSPAAGE
jgi:hypothetical protein